MTEVLVLSVRERILRAAEKLFVEAGYYTTSIPDIVEESGTSIGAVYHHFGSKEELARQLHRHAIDTYSARVEREVLPERTARARIHAYARLMLTWADEDPHFVSYLMYQRPKEVVEGGLTVCCREGLDYVVGIVADGQAAGELRAGDHLVLAAVLSGSLMRLIELRLEGVLGLPLAEQVDQVAGALWEGVGV